jgi:hypothetical protein
MTSYDEIKGRHGTKIRMVAGARAGWIAWPAAIPSNHAIFRKYSYQYLLEICNKGPGADWLSTNRTTTANDTDGPLAAASRFRRATTMYQQ